MKIATRPVLVLHGNPELRSRIRNAAAGTYTVHRFPDWDALAEALPDTPPSALVVVDPYADASRPDRSSPELHALLDRFPSVPVLAALDVTPERTEDLVRLAEAGLADVIVMGHDDTRDALLARLRSAHGRTLKALLDRALPQEAGARAKAVLDNAAEVVTAGGVARDLARTLGVSRRTLVRWVEQAQLPPPRRLLAWMRILLAAELLDDPGRTVIGVARACGYSSDPGLRRVLTRFVGASPTKLRRRGAFAAAAAAFAADLERRRSGEG